MVLLGSGLEGFGLQVEGLLGLLQLALGLDVVGEVGDEGCHPIAVACAVSADLEQGVVPFAEQRGACGVFDVEVGVEGFEGFEFVSFGLEEGSEGEAVGVGEEGFEEILADRWIEAKKAVGGGVEVDDGAV